MILALACLAGGAVGEPSAPDEAEKPFPCMAHFDVLDAAAAEKYAATLSAIEKGEIDTAAATLHALARDYGEVFVPSDDDARRCVGVRAAVRGLLADNAELCAAYDLFSLGDEENSRSGPAKTRMLARDYPQGTAGRTALLRLAQAYYEADRCEDALWACCGSSAFAAGTPCRCRGA